MAIGISSSHWEYEITLACFKCSQASASQLEYVKCLVRKKYCVQALVRNGSVNTKLKIMVLVYMKFDYGSNLTYSPKGSLELLEEKQVKAHIFLNRKKKMLENAYLCILYDVINLIFSSQREKKSLLALFLRPRLTNSVPLKIF